MNDTNKLHAINRIEWREWLEKNHATVEELWLIFYRKSTGVPSIEYKEAVEEALCFGWIDGLRKRFDEKRYGCRFTPRRPRSKWSPLNIKMAEKMLGDGKMTPAGLEAYKNRIPYEKEFQKVRESKTIELTPEIEKAFKKNKKAWDYFTNLAPSHKKHYIGWIISAKREETRKKRIKEAVQLLSKNEKLGMK